MSTNLTGVTSLTFHNNQALKGAMLARFCAHLEAGRVKSLPNTWNGETGSVIGCATESDDLAVWTTALGLPKWLALLIDAVAAGQGTPEAFALAGRPTLEAIPVGVDLERAGSEFVLKLLADIGIWLGKAAPHVPLSEVLATVTALHEAVLAGKRPEAADWRAARRAAMAVADSCAEHSIEQLMASTVEAAGWDAGHSPTMITDVMRAWVNAYSAYALLDAGWTAADEANVYVRLKEMHDRFLKDNPESKRTVFEHYAEQYPAEEERLRWRMRTAREAVSTANAMVSTMLLAVLQAHSVD
ncbi:hypothetical protein ACTOWA_02840 [Herbaspirillum seropedicae]|uniref:hypothetical protein n=1 Tax=Herbaspirillum seropedicae TaxID=964 RepID=UPI003F8CFB0F